MCSGWAQDRPPEIGRKANTVWDRTTPLTMVPTMARSRSRLTTSWHTRKGVYRPRNSRRCHEAFRAWWATQEGKHPRPQPFVGGLPGDLPGHQQQKEEGHGQVDATLPYGFRFHPRSPPSR